MPTTPKLVVDAEHDDDKPKGNMKRDPTPPDEDEGSLFSWLRVHNLFNYSNNAFHP
jgi:hypothetical protein